MIAIRVNGPAQEMAKVFLAIISVLSVLFLPVIVTAQGVSDNDVRKMMIEESISSYPGNCPCPYNSASNGSRCGKRSAWSRAGGYAPLCYDRDISSEMMKKYKQKSNISNSKK